MDSSPSTIEKRLPTGVQASISAWVDEIANKNMALNSDGNGPVPLAVSRTARVTKKAARTGARRATTKSLTNVVRPVVIPERDRKSTRLNSTHQIIPYPAFSLKKKK